MIDERREINISKCPFCGGTQFAHGYQNGYAAITRAKSLFKTSSIEHIICLSCGSIVNSRVKRINKFRKNMQDF
jgi:ribosomal protein L32